MSQPTPYRALLRRPDLRRLFLAQTISSLGTWIGLIALNVKVYDLTQSSLGVAALFALLALPSLLFGLLGGVIVDRVDRRRTMVLADGVRAVLTLALLASQHVGLLYGLIFLHAIAGVFYRTARLAIVPQVIDEREQLLAANALLNTAQTATLVLGPAAGGLLVAMVGVPAAFVLDAGTFVASALLLVGLRAGAAPETAGTRRPVGTHLREGLAFVRQNRAVALLIVSTSAMMLGTGAVNALEVVYAQTVLHVGEVGYGLLLSSWGLGLLLGTLGIGQWGARAEPGRLFVGAMAGLGAALALYGYAPGLLVALAIGVGGGAANGVLVNLVQTLLQRLTPVEMLGRVGGLFTTARDVTVFLSMMVAGGLADSVGVPLVFLVAGLLVAGAAALPLLLVRSPVARLDWLSA